MKFPSIHLILFLATAFVARAQLPLNPGDVWTNSFHTLPFVGTRFPMGAGTSYGNLQMTFTRFGNGAALRYEMFEGVSAEGNATRSGLITSGANFSTTESFAFLWHDLNGSIRLTMLTGECAVGSVTYEVGKPFPENPFNRVDTYTAGVSITSPPPRLVITRLSNVLEVSWWSNNQGAWLLQSTNVLDGGVLNSSTWPYATQNVHLVRSNRFGFIVDPLDRSYFRLIRFDH